MSDAAYSHGIPVCLYTLGQRAPDFVYNTITASSAVLAEDVAPPGDYNREESRFPFFDWQNGVIPLHYVEYEVIKHRLKRLTAQSVVAVLGIIWCQKAESLTDLYDDFCIEVAHAMDIGIHELDDHPRLIFECFAFEPTMQQLDSSDLSQCTHLRMLRNAPGSIELDQKFTVYPADSGIVLSFNFFKSMLVSSAIAKQDKLLRAHEQISEIELSSALQLTKSAPKPIVLKAINLLVVAANSSLAIGSIHDAIVYVRQANNLTSLVKKLALNDQLDCQVLAGVIALENSRECRFGSIIGTDQEDPHDSFRTAADLYSTAVEIAKSMADRAAVAEATFMLLITLRLLRKASPRLVQITDASYSSPTRYSLSRRRSSAFKLYKPLRILANECLYASVTSRPDYSTWLRHLSAVALVHISVGHNRSAGVTLCWLTRVLLRTKCWRMAIFSLSVCLGLLGDCETKKALSARSTCSTHCTNGEDVCKVGGRRIRDFYYIDLLLQTGFILCSAVGWKQLRHQFLGLLLSRCSPSVQRCATSNNLLSEFLRDMVETNENVSDNNSWLLCRGAIRTCISRPLHALFMMLTPGYMGISGSQLGPSTYLRLGIDHDLKPSGSFQKFSVGIAWAISDQTDVQPTFGREMYNYFSSGTSISPTSTEVISNTNRNVRYTPTQTTHQSSPRLHPHTMLFDARKKSHNEVISQNSVAQSPPSRSVGSSPSSMTSLEPFMSGMPNHLCLDSSALEGQGLIKTLIDLPTLSFTQVLSCLCRRNKSETVSASCAPIVSRPLRAIALENVQCEFSSAQFVLPTERYRSVVKNISSYVATAIFRGKSSNSSDIIEPIVVCEGDEVHCTLRFHNLIPLEYPATIHLYGIRRHCEKCENVKSTASLALVGNVKTSSSVRNVQVPFNLRKDCETCSPTIKLTLTSITLGGVVFPGSMSDYLQAPQLRVTTTMCQLMPRLPQRNVCGELRVYSCAAHENGISIQSDLNDESVTLDISLLCSRVGANAGSTPRNEFLRVSSDACMLVNDHRVELKDSKRNSYNVEYANGNWVISLNEKHSNDTAGADSVQQTTDHVFSLDLSSSSLLTLSSQVQATAGDQIMMWIVYNQPEIDAYRRICPVNIVLPMESAFLIPGTGPYSPNSQAVSSFWTQQMNGYIRSAMKHDSDVCLELMTSVLPMLAQDTVLSFECLLSANGQPQPWGAMSSELKVTDKLSATTTIFSFPISKSNEPTSMQVTVEYYVSSQYIHHPETKSSASSASNFRKAIITIPIKTEETAQLTKDS